MHLKSGLLSSLPGISHGFGSVSEPFPESLRAAWESARPQWKQVHGVSCAEVSGPSQLCGDVDALHSSRPGQPVAVVTADCVPVLLARPASHGRPARVAAVHAGWRGTRARILEKLWEKLAALGETPESWAAAIGPAIGPCCYEVSEELAADFTREFAGHGASLVSPRHRILDLPAINAAELRRLGIGQVDLLRACTRCSRDSAGNPVFHSYRREGGGTRQWSAISST